VPYLQLVLIKKDLEILKNIQIYFGVGSIYYNKKDDCYQYLVQSIKDLNNVIIPHFLNYPLLSQKQIDFYLFKQIIELMNAKEHLNLLGLQKIVNIRASLNKGLSKKLEEAFPNCSPFPRPLVKLTEILDPN
jgi:hypothetical protein